MGWLAIDIAVQDDEAQSNAVALNLEMLKLSWHLPIAELRENPR